MRSLWLPQKHGFKDRDSVAPVLCSMVQLLEVVLILDVDKEEEGQSFRLGVHLVDKLGDDAKTSAGSPHGVLQVVVVPMRDHLRSISNTGTIFES